MSQSPLSFVLPAACIERPSVREMQGLKAAEIKDTQLNVLDVK